MKRTSLLFVHSLLLLFGILLYSLFPSHTYAHTNSYGYMNIHDQQWEVQIDLTLDYQELASVADMAINLDATPTITELERALSDRENKLMDYIASGMKIYRDELICEPQLQSTMVSMIDEHPLANFQLLYSCEGKSTRISYDLF